MTSSTSPSVLPLKDKRLLRALAYYAAYVVLSLTLSAFGPTLDGLQAQTGSTVSQISIIFPANSLGFALGALLVCVAPTITEIKAITGCDRPEGMIPIKLLFPHQRLPDSLYLVQDGGQHVSIAIGTDRFYSGLGR